MPTLKRLAVIAAGYVLSVACGLAAVAVNELFMPAEVAEGSPGMVAFGDMVLLVFVTGFLGLAPTWFLLKLLVDRAPLILLGSELLIAAMAPVSWLAMTTLASIPERGLSSQPQAGWEFLGLLIAFGAVPRIVLGPIVLVIEGLTFFLLRRTMARALLGAAMLVELIPLVIFALHLARATRY